MEALPKLGGLGRQTQLPVPVRDDMGQRLDTVVSFDRLLQLIEEIAPAVGGDVDEEDVSFKIKLKGQA